MAEGGDKEGGGTPKPGLNYRSYNEGDNSAKRVQF
jgi:hypothetical protein